MPKKTEQKKRSSYLSVKSLPLMKKPIVVWGYDKDDTFVCRLEINSAGVEIFGGPRGNQQIANLNWEGLVDAVTPDKK